MTYFNSPEALRDWFKKYHEDCVRCKQKAKYMKDKLRDEETLESGLEVW